MLFPSSAFPSAGRNDGPEFRYESDRQASAASRNTSSEVSPSHGARPSRSLVELRNHVSDGMARRTAFEVLTPHLNLRPRLSKASGGRAIERLFMTNQKLHERLDDHSGPVVMLDASGYPKYMFERIAGEWRGFHAVGDKPLPEDCASPALMMAKLVETLPPGTVFTFYEWAHQDAAHERRLERDRNASSPYAPRDERRPLLNGSSSDVSLDDGNSIASEHAAQGSSSAWRHSRSDVSTLTPTRRPGDE